MLNSNAALPPHSDTFALFSRAVLKRKQITCWYNEYPRELCPHIVGHKNGIEMAQVFQFGGSSEKGLEPGGQYRCFRLDKVIDPVLRDGRWHGDEKHKLRQKCVDVVYIHADLSVPNQPGRPR